VLHARGAWKKCCFLHTRAFVETTQSMPASTVPHNARVGRVPHCHTPSHSLCARVLLFFDAAPLFLLLTSCSAHTAKNLLPNVAFFLGCPAPLTTPPLLTVSTTDTCPFRLFVLLAISNLDRHARTQPPTHFGTRTREERAAHRSAAAHAHARACARTLQAYTDLLAPTRSALATCHHRWAGRTRRSAR
jgi:hypothetical protein